MKVKALPHVLPLQYTKCTLEKTKEPAVPETFEKLYAPLLKEIFTTKAQQTLAAGADGLITARAYAEQGKPEFVLAFLLLIDLPEGEKRELFAHAYERRATLSEEKAKQYNLQFHRPFPLIKLEAQKDRVTAHSIREGKRIRSDTTRIPPVS